MLWFCSLLLCSSCVFANIFPERSKNIDLIYLQDAGVDFSLRLKAIDEAKTSIAILTYFQVPDLVGLEFIKALRRALKRGVRVQFFYEGSLGLLLSDPLSKTARFLIDTSLPRQAEVIAGRVSEKVRSGLGLLDFEHQKVLIVDGETNHERIFVGARPYTKFALRTSDTAFLIRTVNPKEPSVADDIRRGFDDTWQELLKRYRVETPRVLSKRDLRLLESPSPLHLLDSTTKKALFADFVSLMAGPLSETDVLHSQQFRPRSTQWITNDLFQQLRERPGLGKAAVRREEVLQNDILKVVSRRIETARDLDFISYVIALPRALNEAVTRFLNRGGKACFFSNGKSAHSLLSPKGVAVFNTLESVPFLLDSPGAQIYLYKTPSPLLRMPRYRHERMMILDGETVITGADPFTESSAWKNSESILFLKDKRLADLFAKEQAAKLIFYERLTSESMAALLKERPWWAGCARKLMRAIY